MAPDPELILHERYSHQADWSRLNRERFYSTLAFKPDFRVLEVGSGSGVITKELTSLHPIQVYGLDIDPAITAFAASRDSSSRYIVGDGSQLPFPSASFNTVLCHFLLLWVHSPERILEEMARVTIPGGRIAALAEPDYDARIDYPETLELLGVLQSESLQRRGADSFMGRRLRALFSDTGLTEVISGVLGGEWSTTVKDEEVNSEWVTLHSDLEHTLSDAEIKKYRAMDQEAHQDGQRILFVPTFYAFGRVPWD
jgi:SAM-dependent methyltransferase